MPVQVRQILAVAGLAALRLGVLAVPVLSSCAMPTRLLFPTLVVD
jgi:hypothetical protein